MTHSLFDIGTPGFKPSFPDKPAPRVKFSHISKEENPIELLAAVMVCQRMHCRCGASHDGPQFLLFRMRRGATGRPWLHGGDDAGMIFALHPTLPREVQHTDHECLHCLACFQPTITTSGTGDSHVQNTS